MGKIFRFVGMGVLAVVAIYLVLLVSPFGDDLPPPLTEEQRTICAMSIASGDEAGAPDYCSRD